MSDSNLSESSDEHFSPSFQKWLPRIYCGDMNEADNDHEEFRGFSNSVYFTSTHKELYNELTIYRLDFEESKEKDKVL